MTAKSCQAPVLMYNRYKMKTAKLTTEFGLHALVWREGKWFVAKGVEINIASQGKSKKEALDNLEEAIALYLEDEKITTKKSFTNLELATLQYA